MTPKQIGAQYSCIAQWWLEQMQDSTYGLSALQRALQFLKGGHTALDVGCGCEGRFLRTLHERGLRCTGLDVSEVMIGIAKTRLPEIQFVTGDICNWSLPEPYDLICAWDSIFHLPLEAHEPVLQKLCAGLRPGGVLLFTCGGVEQPGEISGEMNAQRFDYSSIGVPAFVRCLSQAGMTLRHLEYDQFPEHHVTIIGQRPSVA